MEGIRQAGFCTNTLTITGAVPVNDTGHNAQFTMVPAAPHRRCPAMFIWRMRDDKEKWIVDHLIFEKCIFLLGNVYMVQFLILYSERGTRFCNKSIVLSLKIKHGKI